jgi:threonine/homoserine/homoserine lactone efflux protein
MSFEHINLMLFIMASFTLIITPGPDMIYVISRGIGQGRTAGILSACGVCCGLVLHTLAVAIGLAIVLKTCSIAFYVLKYIGALYLIYLGIRTLTVKQGLISVKHKKRQSHTSLFLQGFLTNVLNPKVALFFLSFLPQFVDSNSPAVALQSILLGLIYFLLCLVVLVIIALLSGKIGSLLQAKESIARKTGWISGSVLMGLGIGLLLPGRS